LSENPLRKSRAVPSGDQWCPPLPFKMCPAFHVWPSLLYTSNIVFKNYGPLVVFGPPAAKSWRRKCVKAFQLTEKSHAYGAFNHMEQQHFDMKNTVKSLLLQLLCRLLQTAGSNLCLPRIHCISLHEFFSVQTVMGCFSTLVHVSLHRF